MEIKLFSDILIKLSMCVAHDSDKSSIIFLMSKVKVIIGKYESNAVNVIESNPVRLSVFGSNFAHKMPMRR